jgi:hypothetical protein
MEPLWSPVVATGGDRSQTAEARNRQKQAKTVAVGSDRLPSRFDTIRTVAAPAPSRAGHVCPHSVHVETDARPLSGSVVPSWSHRSTRCPSVSDSM